MNEGPKVGHDGLRKNGLALPVLEAHRQVSLAGQRYLELMGQTFPVMTASENFYTFPRAHATLAHPGKLETLSESSVTAALSAVEILRGELTRIDSALLDLETRIDWHLLWDNMSTFLRDFGRRRVWQTDPVMYLKIVNLCCELNPAERLPQVPLLLAEAQRNLHRVPRIALEIALAMLSNEGGLTQQVADLAEEQQLGTGALEALAAFERFLRHDLVGQTVDSFAVGGAEYDDLLRTFAGVSLGVEQVWQEGWELHAEADEALRQVAARISPGLSVHELEDRLRERLCPSMDLRILHAQSLEEARELIGRRGILTMPDDGDYTIDVVGTSGSFKAIKSVAGYNCAHGQKRATLHINLDDPRQHAEYRLTVAHELYPGHHLQGVAARLNPRPVRQQIQVPIFYEGWATYAERLMIEQGFWPADEAWFFYWRQRKFRAARVLADVGLHTGRLTLDGVRRLLTETHLPDELAIRESRRYTITPGYQISYALGVRRIERLRDRFERGLSLRRFHDVVLSGGDMPWRWVEARLETEATWGQASDPPAEEDP